MNFKTRRQYRLKRLKCVNVRYEHLHRSWYIHFRSRWIDIHPHLLLIRCCSLVEEIYIIWSDGLNSSSRRRPALSAIYYPTALMWRSKSGGNCKKRPCSRLWSMLITKYYADHRGLHCWSQGNTRLMIEKYAADHREIFWSILIREKYGSPAIPTQGGFFLIRPSHPMKQSSDPITILIATMMMMTIIND